MSAKMAQLFVRRWNLKIYDIKQFSSKVINHYESLEINSKATQGEIKKAYYKLSKQYHPDVNKSEEAPIKFRDVATAYEILGNYEKRKQYDRTIKVRSPVYQKRENIKPTDISKEAHRAHMEILRHRIQNDGTPIYNFDEWTRAHYEKTFEKTRKDREVVRMYTELITDPATRATSTRAETTLVVLFVIATFSLLICGLSLTSAEYTPGNVVNNDNARDDNSLKKPSD